MVSVLGAALGDSGRVMIVYRYVTKEERNQEGWVYSSADRDLNIRLKYFLMNQ